MPKPKSPRGAGFAVRITSYNVCYTKLLRDSTITILEKYEKLTANPVRDDKIKTSIARVEAMLDTIDKAFEKQLANLLSNDVMDLDAELALLESTINMEGLGD